MKGKVAIVTASSSGIGKAIVTRLAKEGCIVIISSRSQVNIDKAVN
jgi:3-oxoacyl-[acyl-carrier protein] reductase